jgi:D-beta-D-heptose 7-phosphate kinase/D-beta-D-heptose 1-phosphate adenosyltransferase
MNIDSHAFSSLTAVRILVVGDVMLDRYFSGETSRISPEAPVPVVKITHVQDKVGGASNVARNISHLGAHVGLLGLVGQDEHAQCLQDLLAKDNIHSHLISLPNQPTITKSRILSRQQQIVRLDYEEVFSDTAGQQVAEQFAHAICDYDSIVFSDYNKGTLQQLQAMIAVACKAGKTIFIDPKSPDFSFYRGADVVTPNLSEFKAAGGCVESESDILASARNLLAKHSIGAILLTRSEQGMTWITACEHHHFAAQVREVTDVTGAGDTVIATLATFICAGVQHSVACMIANMAAGIVVGKLGAAAVSTYELSMELSRHGYTSAVGAPAPAIEQIHQAQQAGERIVFTNGCFDILHAGHVRYLVQARAMGDRLVVGLNSDASVRRLKGLTRPINTWDDRATVLAALQSVDWVLPFGDNPTEQDTPLNLIEKVNPQVLVKGGDYSPDSIVGASSVIANGGQVKVVSFVDGKSTSGILNKIANAERGET